MQMLEKKGEKVNLKGSPWGFSVTFLTLGFKATTPDEVNNEGDSHHYCNAYAYKD